MFNGEQFKTIKERHCTSIIQLIKQGALKKIFFVTRIGIEKKLESSHHKLLPFLLKSLLRFPCLISFSSTFLNKEPDM